MSAPSPGSFPGSFPGFGQVVERLERHLARREPRRLHVHGFREAAVAVVLFERGGDAQVILTERSKTLRAHSGQVSFPGGVRDAEDGSSADAARREASEEIGLSPASMRVLGELDDQLTPSGYIITPVIGQVEAPPVYQLNRAEVAQVIEAPLGAFADPERAEPRGERRVGEHVYPLRAYRHGAHVVTGATAHILELVCALALTP